MSKKGTKTSKTSKTLKTLSWTPSEEQQHICDCIKQGHNVAVDACAGSGKSTTILSVAHTVPTKKILQITYNASLRKEFKEKVTEYGIKNIDVHTYHSLAVQYFSSDAHTDAGIRKVLYHNLIRPEITDVPTYDVIVLDEAQDMSHLYYRFVLYFMGFCSKKRRKFQLLILGDYMQGLYEFKGADIRFLTMASEIWSTCSFLKTPHFELCNLRTSYRITKPMAAFVNNVMLGCGQRDEALQQLTSKGASHPEKFGQRDEALQQLTSKGASHPEKFGQRAETPSSNDDSMRLCAIRDGVPVTYLRNSRANLERIVVYHILKILEEGDLPEDIFVLSASVKGINSNVRKMENALVERGIPCHIPMLENDKMDERVIRGKVVFSTFHTVKGRQRKYVIVVGFDQSYFAYFAKNIPIDQCPNTLYVACTRATHRMILLENNDRSTDQPLRFLTMDHYELRDQEYIDFKGQPQTLFYEKEPEMSSSIVAKPNIHYVTPTDLIKFVPEHVLEMITPWVEDMFVNVSDEMPNIEMASVVYCKKTGLYEDVADLNGIALPCLFWDRIKTKGHIDSGCDDTSTLYTLIGSMLADMKSNEHVFLKRKYQEIDKDACSSAADYLYMANLYVAVQEKLYFKMTQISKDEYDWLPEDVVESCIRRLEKVVACEPVLAHEHVLIHHKMEEEHAQIDSILNPYFDKFGQGAECPQNRERYRFSARLDMITETTVWEIKCTQQLTFDHRLQVLIYAWLWRLVPGFDSDQRAFTPSGKKIKIFNIKSGEILELRATTEELTRVMVELLRGKYSKPPVLSDTEFMDQVKEPTNLKHPL